LNSQPLDTGNIRRTLAPPKHSAFHVKDDIGNIKRTLALPKHSAFHDKDSHDQYLTPIHIMGLKKY
jgi:hypothetical protein